MREMTIAPATALECREATPWPRRHDAHSCSARPRRRCSRAGTIAQAAFPSRPMRIVIGFPPGGGIDILARLMAPKMSERLGQPVDRREPARRERPDRHPGRGAIGARRPHHPVRHHGQPRGQSGALRRPVRHRHGARLRAAVAWSPRSPSCWWSIHRCPRSRCKELIDLAKAQPGRDAVRVERQRRPAASVRRTVEPAGRRSSIRHVPYRGSAPAFTDLISGQVQFVFDALAIAQPHIEIGQLAARSRRRGRSGWRRCPTCRWRRTRCRTSRW